MDISLRMLADASNATGAFKDVGSAATAAGKVMLDFAKDSVKAFADAERVQRQLKLAAGSSTAALNEQAEAMKRKFAVDDDAIRHMDVLLLRYGAAPTQIQATTEAVLDYAAATGKDATQAMEMLIRGVESGTGSLGKMGVHFKQTGNFAGDLKNAVEALGKKFGGAGESDAGSLDGRMRSIGLAVDDLKKTFGSMFDDLDRRFGFLDKIAKGLNDINAELQRDGLKAFFGLKASSSQEKNVRDSWQLMGGDPNDPDFLSRVSAAQATDQQSAGLIGFLKSRGAIPSDAGQVLPGLSDVGNDHAVGKDAKNPGKSAVDAINAASRDDERLARQAQYNKEWIRAEEEFQLQQEELAKKAAERQLDHIDESNRAMMKAFEDQEKEHTKDLQKLGEMQFEYMKQQTDQQARELQRRQSMWLSIGQQIGNALIQGIFAALDQGKEGGGEHWGKTATKVTQGVMGALFGMFGMGFMTSTMNSVMQGSQEGQDDAALFGTAMQGLGGGAASSRHTGGSIDRFHNGGTVLGRDERMAVLQTGEEVLSRSQVDRIGGRRGIDAAMNGGGRGITIQAFDSSSLLNFFGDRGGMGMLNAARTNVGPLSLMFKRR